MNLQKETPLQGFEKALSHDNFQFFSFLIEFSWYFIGFFEFQFYRESNSTPAI